ncbi:hypothetical protein [Citrobacter koseri]|uniref:hypothetical protein n=1 Tax=Citrobacter koseri TaxID=545 RepID=UPI001F318492|nr:hypothetical protein [Citrobacter koseri]
MNVLNMNDESDETINLKWWINNDAPRVSGSIIARCTFTLHGLSAMYEQAIQPAGAMNARSVLPEVREYGECIWQEPVFCCPGRSVAEQLYALEALVLVLKRRTAIPRVLLLIEELPAWFCPTLTGMMRESGIRATVFRASPTVPVDTLRNFFLDRSDQRITRVRDRSSYPSVGGLSAMQVRVVSALLAGVNMYELARRTGVPVMTLYYHRRKGLLKTDLRQARWLYRRGGARGTE